MRFDWLVFAMLLVLFVLWAVPPARSELRLVALMIGALLLVFMFLSLTHVVVLG